MAVKRYDGTQWVLYAGAGAQGLTGTQGTFGNQGTQGTQGSQGFSGSGTPGAQGTQGTFGPISGINLSFVTGTSSTSSATANQFNFNNITLASVTAMYINNASGSALATGDIVTISLGTTYAQFQVNGSVTLASSIYTVPVTYQASSGTFTNGTTYGVIQSNIGTQGLAGSQGTQGANTTIATTNNLSTNYTLLTSDQDKLLLFSGTGIQYISIPTNASAALPVGAVVHVSGVSSGTYTIQALTPATTAVQSVGAIVTAPKLRAQYSTASLTKIASDAWLIMGDVS